MNSLTLLLITLAACAAAFFLYGRFLSKTFGIDPSRKTPAHASTDGVDYVPAPNAWVLFGHHFASICGAGPIIGPVLACAYWGWGASALWIIGGAIWMGAVSDFSALIMSVRARGESVSQVAGAEISRRAQLFFSVFIWIALILVIAVFTIFAAQTFIEEPEAVVPSLGLIPTALMTGWLVYSRQVSMKWVTGLGLLILIGLLAAGTLWPVALTPWGGMSPQVLWVILLLFYCFVASVAPVHVLLQPRDYLASFILYGLIVLGFFSIFMVRPEMQMQAFRGFNAQDWPEAGPLWPMLFITIACGAISGFHALVSSGTTSKQIGCESHSCGIGYGGMLLECVVGILVVIMVCAGMNESEFISVLKTSGPIAAFGRGYGALSEKFLGGYGKAFAILALNAFILTTLDTAARITRYVTTELFGIKNTYVSAGVVVFLSGALALSGRWNLLWPAFGAANQLIAGITLLIASCWLLNRRRHFMIALVPALIMLVTTTAAFALQFLRSATRHNATGGWAPELLMCTLALILTGIAGSILFEARHIFRLRRQGTASTIF